MEVAAAVGPAEEQHELVRQLQFPPGYHFVPTEQELVEVYLRGKIEGQRPPLDVVNEVSVLDWQPGSLVDAYKAYGEHKWYFFTIREPSSSNKEEEPNRKVRVPGVKATWKATGSVVVIMAKRNNNKEGEEGEHADDEKVVVVGTKRVLIYHSSDAQENGKWSMHEYILEGHGKIGQYALCSIQRKQHSDTVANDGEGRRIIRRNRKRTKATDVDAGQTKKKRQRASKAASAQPEGVQLQQQEIASAEAPLKPKSRTRRAATKGKNNKPSAQAEVQQQKQPQHLEVASVSPAVPPLAPPHQQAPAQASQQEQNPLAAHSAPVLTALPLQGYPSHPDGIMLGASSPMHEEDMLLARSFQFHYDEESLQRLSNLIPSFTCNEVITDRDAQYQLDQEQRDRDLFGVQNQNVYPGTPHFFGNITLNNSSWIHDDHGQIYQEEIGGSAGAPDQQRHNSWVMHDHDQFFYPQEIGGSVGAPNEHTNNSLMPGHDQIYQQENGCLFGEPDQPTNNSLYDQPYEYQMHVSPLEQAGYFSSDLAESVQGDTVASGSDDDVDYYLDYGGMSDLPDDDPQGCDGTLDGSDPEVLQSKDEPQLPCGQQQHTANGQVCDGTPLDCYVSVFRPQYDEAVRGGSFTVLGR